jgi:hypothetical protein
MVDSLRATLHANLRTPYTSSGSLGAVLGGRTLRDEWTTHGGPAGWHGFDVGWSLSRVTPGLMNLMSSRTGARQAGRLLKGARSLG